MSEFYLPPDLEKKSKKTGVVIMLDALGVRDKSLDSPLGFLFRFQQFLSFCECIIELVDFYYPIKRESENKRILLPKFHKHIRNTLKFNILGDTVIFSTETPKKFDPEKQLAEFLFAHIPYATVIMMASLSSNLYMRGSMAYGSYINQHFSASAGKKYQGTICVGDAVSDAANWCEAADWIGLHMTPRTSLLWEAYDYNQVEKHGKMTYLKYSVPLSQKNGLNQKLNVMCCPWPYGFVFDLLKRDPCYEKETILSHARINIIKDLTEQRYMPKGVEQKYFNTMEYVDHTLKEFSKIIDILNSDKNK